MRNPSRKTISALLALLLAGIGSTAFASENLFRVYIPGVQGTPAVASSPGNVSFGNVPVGSSSPAQGVQIDNTGTTPLTVGVITLTGPYAAVSNCPNSLPFSQDCNINVTFSPTQIGSLPGTMTVQTGAGAQTISLSGTGTASQLGISPSTVAFGTIYTNQPNTQTFSLVNSGNVAASSLTFSLPPGITQTNNCGSSLAAGASCTVTLTDTPTVAGSVSGTVTVVAPDSQASTSVTGTIQTDIVASGSTRTWSDGTTAGSCNAYLNPKAPYVYAGATGSGIYSVTLPGGTTEDVYCDMVDNGGGWTLIMKQANGDGATLEGDTTYWTNGTTLNDSDSSLNTNDGNFVSGAFAALPVTQLVLQASNESTYQTQSLGSAMTPMTAFSNTNMTDYADPLGTWAPSAPDWFLHTTTYPDGEALTAARFGFNFGEIWTSTYPGVIRCGARWGWAGNQDDPPDPTGIQSGSFDACGGLGAWGAAYGSSPWMNSNVNSWQPATLLLWAK